MDLDCEVKEFGSLDIIVSDNLKLRLQTHWKIRNSDVETLDIVLVYNNTLWKGSVNGWMLKDRAHNLGLEYNDYCESLKYAFTSPVGPKNDIVCFENGVLRWQKIVKVDFLISYGDFTLNLIADSILLVETISSLLDSNYMLKEECDKISEQNSEIQRGWNNLKSHTEEMIKIKDQLENKLYAQFVAILNEKKNKICELRRGRRESF